MVAIPLVVHFYRSRTYDGSNDLIVSRTVSRYARLQYNTLVATVYTDRNDHITNTGTSRVEKERSKKRLRNLTTLGTITMMIGGKNTA